MTWLTWPIAHSVILNSGPPTNESREEKGEAVSSHVTISLAQGSASSELAHGLTSQTLSRAQERFAEENRAFPGERSLADDRMMFFYREGTMLTRRWLVDEDGRVVQLDSFARTPRTAEGDEG
jgi:hypothetical protein